MKTANVKLSELRRVIEATLTGKSLNREEKFAYLLGMRSLLHVQNDTSSKLHACVQSHIDKFDELMRGPVTGYKLSRDEFTIKFFEADELALAEGQLENFAKAGKKHQTFYLDKVFADNSAETVDFKAGENE